MKHTIIFLLLTGLCTTSLLVVPSYQQDNKDSILPALYNQQPQQPSQMSEKNILCKYYDEKDFLQSVSAAQSADISSQKIKGGIVPHHLLAKDMIASFFKTVSAEQPEVVVVIAPNHKGTGIKNVHTGSWNWQTPFGILESDQDTISSLIDSKTADMDFNLLEKDHSIAGLVPYIKYYMPNSKIVPVLLHGTYGLKDSQQLGKNLQKKLQNKKSLILASVDFSHYLPLEKADEMDEISIKAIEDRAVNLIQHLNNDHMDSPSSINTLLSAMNAAGVDGMKVIDHSNSDRITGARSNDTTSYFTIIFY
ncbi:MAG: AmmeMemoRadiSam system protein B [Clostridia bacterium]